MKRKILLGMDFEDVALRTIPQERFDNNVKFTLLTKEILDLFQKLSISLTCFVVGDVIQHHPNCISMLVEHGHELAWHSFAHKPLSQQAPDEFKRELDTTLALLRPFGIKQLYGYRAPFFSATEKTQWIYPILKEYGFEYSSSVLPTKWQTYCWPNFGDTPRKIAGIWEIPVSSINIGITRLPLGGVYFRVLPWLLMKNKMAKISDSRSLLVSYLHPYDFDWREKSGRFSDAHINPVWNWFLYLNRDKVTPRITELISDGFSCMKYHDLVRQLGD